MVTEGLVSGTLHTSNPSIEQRPHTHADRQTGTQTHIHTSILAYCLIKPVDCLIVCDLWIEIRTKSWVRWGLCVCVCIYVCVTHSLGPRRDYRTQGISLSLFSSIPRTLSLTIVTAGKREKAPADRWQMVGKTSSFHHSPRLHSSLRWMSCSFLFLLQSFLNERLHIPSDCADGRMSKGWEGS